MKRHQNEQNRYSPIHVQYLSGLKRFAVIVGFVVRSAMSVRDPEQEDQQGEAAEEAAETGYYEDPLTDFQKSFHVL